MTDDKNKVWVSSEEWIATHPEEFAFLNPKSSEPKVLPLEQLTAYQLADELSDRVWEIVIHWDWFAKKTVGDQFVRAVDSIGANTAESYGRYFFQDSVLFLYYARGSCFESQFWAKKALARGLITNDQYSFINDCLQKLPRELNTLIKIKRNAAKNWKIRR